MDDIDQLADAFLDLSNEQTTLEIGDRLDESVGQAPSSEAMIALAMATAWLFSRLPEAKRGRMLRVFMRLIERGMMDDGQ